MRQAAGAGLGAAAVLLVLVPGIRDSGPVVTIRQQPIPGLIAGSPQATATTSYAQAIAMAAPAVVNIFTSTRVTISPDTTPMQVNQVGLGSGVIVSKQGYVLTNNHVIAGADQVDVMLQDSRSARAEIIGTDPETDLAVLKIELDDLPSVTLGSARRLRVGDIVLAIGNPFGVGQTVTMGIVSATGRRRLGLSTTFEDYIQTDAAINPGNSGGALISARGTLVGINTAIFPGDRTLFPRDSQGISFAIPLSIASAVAREIIEKGRVVRGWLGAEVQPNAQRAGGPRRATVAGVVIGGVVPNGPAEKSGLLPGDTLTHIDAKPVETPEAAINFIAARAPGQTVTLSIIRNGKSMTLQATIGERSGAGP